MLQIPAGRLTERTIIAISKNARPAKKQSPSQLSKLIANFREARRVLVSAEQRYQALCLEFPDIVDQMPAILLFTSGDGQKIYGDGVDDIERYFPQSTDSWSPSNKKRREELKEKLKVARDERRAAQDKHGLSSARLAMYSAQYKQKRCFVALCRHRPATLANARTLSRFVRKWLSQVATDLEGNHHNLFGQSSSHEAYEGWKEARGDAFEYLTMLTLSLGKAGDQK